VASADSFMESEGHESGAALDVSAASRLTSNVQVLFRPVLYRDHDGEWDADVYQLAVRWDRPGAVRLRVEGGYLPSPIGILALEPRADQNPLIAPATSYTATLPRFEVGTPIVQLASALYPFGLQATASTDRWDARAALLESSPVRVRPLTGESKPPRAGQIALGGGVSPYVGLRLGGSFARGAYARRWEVADPSRGDRLATVVGLDADFSRGYTRAYAEWTRAAYERAADTSVASALTATVVRTLTPRWFTAARVQRLSSEHILELETYTHTGGPYSGYPSTGAYPTKTDEEWIDHGAGDALSLETVVGYRLTPELTLRAGYLGYRGFEDGEIEPHATASIVWVRRWR
jgi:hypothetical protein